MIIVVTTSRVDPDNIVPPDGLSFVWYRYRNALTAHMTVVEVGGTDIVAEVELRHDFSLALDTGMFQYELADVTVRHFPAPRYL